MEINEAVEIRLRRARSWLRKAKKAANSSDADSEFIFLWIAFNALYGTPRYLRDPEVNRTDEISDFVNFLDDAQRLARGRLDPTLKDVESETQAILWSPFLNISCWRKWDAGKTRERQKRIQTSCNTYDKESGLGRIFLQLYTLRNQLLHGAATDGGSRNRESLERAIPILRAFVPVFIELVATHGPKIRSIKPIPFPPSLGDGGRFNAARFKT
jgi:hypothetical protein